MISRQTMSAIVALLLLNSAVIGGIAIASAENYEKTFGGSPEDVVVDLDGIDNTVTVEVSTNDPPGDTQERLILHRERFDASSLKRTQQIFENAGAYENITMTVKGVESGEPGFTTSIPSLHRSDQWMASTGGDRDLTCNHMERASQVINPFSASVVDCGTLPGSTAVNTTGLDAQQAQVDVFQSAQTQAQSAENTHTMLSNRLQDSEEVALMKGKESYIWEYEKGGSQSAAETNATEGVTEHYSRIERNTLAEWNNHVGNIEYLRGVLSNESGVSKTFINPTYEVPADPPSGGVYLDGFSSTTVQLQNGTSVEAKQVQVKVNQTDDQYSHTYDIGPTTGTVNDATYGGTDSTNSRRVHIQGLQVNAPDENYNTTEIINFQEYSDRFSEIDSQTTSANNEVTDLVAGTYSELENQNISTSDLVDPYVLSNEFSPGSEYEGWAATQLAMMGVNQPEDFGSAGYMNVTLESGETLRGIIHSGDNPQSGQFEVNETYNPADVGGPQYIVTQSGTEELTENFTIDRMTTQDGETRSNFSVEKKTYDTTSAQNLTKLYDVLEMLRAEIEAREDWRRSQSGALLAGIPMIAGLNRAQTAAVGVGGFVVVMYVMRD